jgi:hypothetical protein
MGHMFTWSFRQEVVSNLRRFVDTRSARLITPGTTSDGDECGSLSITFGWGLHMREFPDLVFSNGLGISRERIPHTDAISLNRSEGSSVSTGTKRLDRLLLFDSREEQRFCLRHQLWGPYSHRPTEMGGHFPAGMVKWTGSEASSCSQWPHAHGSTPRSAVCRV